MGDIDISKLSLEDRISHKVWKARVSGYEDLTKLFQRIDDENSSEYNKYLGSLKKFVIDSNAVAQEKGLDAAFAFVECAAPSISGRVAGDVVAGVVAKCLNARPKTKQKGIDIIMMYLEVEKQEAVQEEVMKGLENKQPKIVASCVSVLREAVSAFGGKIFPLKPVVKTLPKLFDHSDKNVREETKALAIEIYKWIRDAIRAPLQNIKPVQLKELDDEWGNLPPGPPAPTRLTRTQQKKLAAEQAQGITPAETQVDGDGETAAQAAQTVEIDPYEMMEAVDVLSKIPKDFYENLENKKWQIRKEALEGLEKIVNSPKLEGGQFGELMSALKKIIAKDSNVMIVAVAGRIVALLATGLRKKFTSYAGMITPVILEKFKEKKPMVVTALRDAIDATFLTTNLSAMQEDILAVLENKNPNVKEETVKFLVRTFAKCNKEMIPKAVLKPLCSSLMKRMDDTVGPVRDAAAEALGTLMKVVGERPLGPYLDKLDKIKMDKVKECSEKAEVKGAPAATAPAAASSKPPSASSTDGAKPPAKKPAAAKPPSKPAGGSAKPASAKGPPKKKAGGGSKSAGGAKKAKGGGNSYAEDQQEPKEPEMTDEQVDERAQALLPAEVLTQLSSTNWKERLAGMETMTKLVSEMDPKTLETQVLIRVLAKKPGWKDTNFQVLKGKFSLCGQIAEMSKPFSKRSAFYALSGLVDKIGDIKLKDQCKETLTIFSEALSLNYVSLKVAKNAGSQKNPKVIAEALNWLAAALRDFGFKIDLKPHIDYIKTALANTNPAVRTAAISLLGTIHMYVGPTIRVFFEEEKPALLQQIDAEIEKVKDEKPPAPTRGIAPKGDDEEDGQEEGGEDGGDGAAAEPAVNLADLVPRNDISGDIKDDLIRDLADKNWKVRGEALQKVIDIINAAKFITPNLGELPGALKARLGDSNKNLVTVSLNICGAIATAMGPQVAKHLRTIGPGIFSTLADAKTGVRAAGTSTLNAWHKEIGLAPFIEGEVVFGALSTENPNLRTEVLGWLEEKLPQEGKLPREEMIQIIAPLYACLEDRSGDVRKKAQSVVPLMMQHVGWDTMSKQVGKLKPASKNTVQAILEKHRGTVPEKTSSKSAPAKASGGVSKAASEPSVSTSSAGSSNAATKKQKAAGNKQTKPSKKASQTAPEDEGPPLLKNNDKDRRIKDENSLKVMKWNFSTPRGEYIEQLKEQMRSCVSSTMLANLFHADFKFHLKAITTLTECVSGDEPAFQTEATQSLDLLLKWVTLRFFDTNTTVLIKTLEFLLALFTMLSRSDYQMLEHESSSFVPYLVNKVGDPKDVIRKMIRNIFKLITKVYPASKMFNYVMEGISSKNAKTRTECLEELGCLIQVYGMNVCQPTPPKALSAMASQIGDRDNGVRNAALNAIVEAYVLVGDTVYKYCGRLSDKDLGYLEERIKRSNKTRPATAPSEGRAKVMVPTNDAPVVAVGKKQAANSQQPRPATAPNKRQENVRREFQLDYDEIEGGAGDHSISIPTLVASDVDDLISQPPMRLPQTSKGPSSPYLGVFSRTNASAALDYVISQIASSDISVSTQAIVQLEMVIKHKTQGEIVKHIDQFIIAGSLQLRMMFTTHMTSDKVSDSEVTRLSNCLVNSLLTLFSSPSLAQAVSCDVLKDLIQVLISALLDDKLIQLEDGPQIIRTINVLMVKIVEKTNHTVSLGALVKLLQESVGSHMSSAKFVELVMKCLWKKVRLLPTNVTEMNLSQVLLDIHTFLKEHPYHVWKTRPDNTPLRTIKTILHSLAKLKGNDILKHLDLIDDPQASETIAYLHKVLKVSGYRPLTGSTSDTSGVNSKTSEGDKKPMNSPTPDLLLGVQGTPKKSTTKMNDVLAEIFRKIGSKENTREGLVELYEFKQNYPDADIDPFLKRSSQFFRNYIERGLKNIEVERKGRSVSGGDSSSSTNTTERSSLTTTSNEDASSYRDRLKVLRMRSGLEGNTNTGLIKNDDPTEKPASLDKTPPEEQPPTLYDSKSALSPIVSADDTPASTESVQLDDIMQRLAKIKKQARQ